MKPGIISGHIRCSLPRRHSVRLAAWLQDIVVH